MKQVEVPLNAFGGYNYKNPTPMRSPALILQDLTVSQRTRKGQLIYVPEIMSTLSDGILYTIRIFKRKYKTAHLLQGLGQKPW